MQTQAAIDKNAQTHALKSFRGALDLLCDALRAEGIPPAEIAEILATQASVVIQEDNPTVAEILGNAADFLPMPRDL